MYPGGITHSISKSRTAPLNHRETFTKQKLSRNAIQIILRIDGPPQQPLNSLSHPTRVQRPTPKRPRFLWQVTQQQEDTPVLPAAKGPMPMTCISESKSKLQVPIGSSHHTVPQKKRDSKKQRRRRRLERISNLAQKEGSFITLFLRCHHDHSDSGADYDNVYGKGNL